MKKGLLSILASALLVVGCQNYDDQFSALETQINALASTVAGLSQVQSDLSSLAGTVASLSSSVSGLGSQIDTAVADGLADITADVAAIQTAVADVASTEEVAALSTAVADANADLDNLLANSSVFNNSVTINSVATLNAFHAMGTSLNIVNGDVTFVVSAGMDATKVQETADQMLTITGDLTYTGAATEAMPTFKNLSGVASMTIEGAGDYRFDGLVSAGNIIIDNDNSSKITIVHFGSLTTYLSLQDDDGTANANAFSSATEFHLTSLKVLAGNKLDVTIDEGGVLAIGALTGLNSLDTTAVLDIDIEGPSSIALTTIKDGNINLKDVKTASISDFYGDIVIDSGVETLTVTKGVALDISSAADLETATIDIATDYDPLLTATAATAAALASTYIAVAPASQDLKNLTVSGKIGTLTVDGQNNLTDLTVSSGAHVTALVAQNNADLENLTITGATIGNVTADNNDNMTSLTLDHTSYVTTAAPGTSVSVDGNADLTGLTIKADKIGILSIETNDDLVKITADGLALTGTATATVSIKDNDLKADAFTDSYNATPSATVADAGSFTQTSIVGFQTYLDAAAAVPTSDGVKVWFDEIASATEQLTSTATAFTAKTITTVAYTGANMYSVVYVEKDNATTTGRTTKQSVTMVLPVARDANGADKLLSTASAGDEITVVNGIGGTKTFADNTTTITTVDQLVAAMNGDTTVPGVTVTAARDAFKQQYVQIAWTTSDGAAGVGSATVTADTTDHIWFTYGTDPETGAAIASQTTVTAGVTTSGIATAIALGFNAVTHAYQATATVNGRIKIVALTSGTLKEDNSSLAHAFNTLAIDTSDSGSTTFLFSGNEADHILTAEASSNTTAIASGFFNLSTPGTTYSGVRVTATNDSTTTNLGSMAITTGATSSAFAGNSGTTTDHFAGLTGNALALAAGANIVAASINSSSLDYVAAFTDVEAPVAVASTAGTTDRTGWLSN